MTQLGENNFTRPAEPALMKYSCSDLFTATLLSRDDKQSETTVNQQHCCPTDTFTVCLHYYTPVSCLRLDISMPVHHATVHASILI
ncbi:hypothetical protein QQF64_028792 [Cirrhinus molitorella]|uniref:Uncharacterized protein n=1 Tax=Cirrhinus molitorella TaxID=172907 RepID=A0ABR3N7M8_9TELE